VRVIIPPPITLTIGPDVCAMNLLLVSGVQALACSEPIF
jgi:hypothetical protein